MVPSSEGVQQGDPEGPPLFSDALMDIVEGVTSEMNEWYLDDGNIADEADVVLNDFRRLIVGLANVGLQIKLLQVRARVLRQPRRAYPGADFEEVQANLHTH